MKTSMRTRGTTNYLRLKAKVNAIKVINEWAQKAKIMPMELTIIEITFGTQELRSKDV